MRIPLFLLMLTITDLSVGGMMGGGMGGMMGSQESPPSPPAKNASPDIRKGYQLVEKFCVQCHQIPNPNQHTRADWPAVVSRMQIYMQQQHRHLLSDKERQLILDYLGKPDTHHDD